MEMDGKEGGRRGRTMVRMHEKGIERRNPPVRQTSFDLQGHLIDNCQSANEARDSHVPSSKNCAQGG